MKILVTGAAGFIGSYVCRRLLSRGDEVVGLDNINSYYDVSLKYGRLETLGIDENVVDWYKFVQSNVYEQFRFVRMSLEDRQAIQMLFANEYFDKVVNLAAQAGVRYSIENPYAYVESNIDGFLNILEGCRHYGIKHLIYASSSSVYGLNGKVPFSEKDSIAHPVSLYAATKKSNELMAHTYSHLYGIPSTGLRFFTVYGPWGRPDMSPFLFADAMLHGRPIKVFNNGDMLRDFTYIDDVVEYDNKAAFPQAGEDGKIYIAKDTNLTYRWSGSEYIEISPSLALGETSSTAYPGDKGKIAYDHSQVKTGNPHNTKFSNLPDKPKLVKIQDDTLPTTTNTKTVAITGGKIFSTMVYDSVTFEEVIVDKKYDATRANVTITTAANPTNALTIVVSYIEV